MKEMLDLSCDDTEILFHISGLVNDLSEDELKHASWCSVDLHIKNRYFCYSHTDDELLTFGEVIQIAALLDDLLNDCLCDVKKIRFVEPDLYLTLHPKLVLQNSSNRIYANGFGEILDIRGELMINLSDVDTGYNGHAYLLPLERNQLEALALYLNTIIPLLEDQWTHRA